jgi:hypothetical protein
MYVFVRHSKGFVLGKREEGGLEMEEWKKSGTCTCMSLVLAAFLLSLFLLCFLSLCQQHTDTACGARPALWFLRSTLYYLFIIYVC